MMKIGNKVSGTRRIVRVDGQLCHYCDQPATTWDHIVPKSLGGPITEWNLVGACGPCNSRKGNKLPTCKCYRCLDAIELFGLYSKQRLDLRAQGFSKSTASKRAKLWIEMASG